ncbi:MAG: LysR family transcriptional regulator [Pseudomonadota bacterium]
MKNWDELKTAYKVATLGKVALAAQALGVHRSTVIRQVDALEQRLGVQLFIREQSGYALTPQGEDLLQVVEDVEKQFTQLERQLSKPPAISRLLLTITSVEALSPILAPIIRRFCFKHRDIRVNFIATEKYLQLEYDEADLAIRPGLPPKSSLYVTNALTPLKLGLYAHKKLKAQHCVEDHFEQPSTLPFATRLGANMTNFETWVSDTVPAEHILYQASSVHALHDFVSDGLAAGFMPVSVAQKNRHLSEIPILGQKWRVPLYTACTREGLETPACALFLEHLRAAEY